MWDIQALLYLLGIYISGLGTTVAFLKNYTFLRQLWLFGFTQGTFFVPTLTYFSFLSSIALLLGVLDIDNCLLEPNI